VGDLSGRAIVNFNAFQKKVLRLRATLTLIRDKNQLPNNHKTCSRHQEDQPKVPERARISVVCDHMRRTHSTFRKLRKSRSHSKNRVHKRRLAQQLFFCAVADLADGVMLGALQDIVQHL
jgi:hypothetical protein